MNQIERLPLDSDLLRTFLAVAAAENVTRAASGLGRTQSAISVQVRRLEQALAVRLFERQARGMALTDEGRRLVPAARRALAELDRVGELFSRQLTGRVRVGVPDDYGLPVLERILAGFAARHPGVEVVVRCGFSVGFPAAVRRGELDLAVFTAEPPGDAGTVLLTEPTVWAAGQDFALPEDLPLPLALFDRACWWRDAALEALDRAGRPYRLAYSSESVAGVKAAIGAGLAVGALALSSLAPSMRVLTEQDGFPPLPASSLVLLGGDAPAGEVVREMASAVRSAFETIAVSSLAAPGRG